MCLSGIMSLFSSFYILYVPVCLRHAFFFVDFRLSSVPSLDRVCIVRAASWCDIRTFARLAPNFPRDRSFSEDMPISFILISSSFYLVDFRLSPIKPNPNPIKPNPNPDFKLQP